MEDKLLEARIKALLLAAKTMAFVIIAITCAMIVGLFVSNEIIDNKDVFGLLSYVMTSVVGAVAGSYATLMGMKGDHGRPLGVNPRLLVVGPSNEKEGLELINAERNAAGATNVYRGTAELLVVPWLT